MSPTDKMPLTGYSMSQALDELKLANNGYLVASYLPTHVRRNIEKGAARGLAVIGMIPNGNGILVKAYFTKKAAAIYCPKPGKAEFTFA